MAAGRDVGVRAVHFGGVVGKELQVWTSVNLMSLQLHQPLKAQLETP